MQKNKIIISVIMICILSTSHVSAVPNYGPIEIPDSIMAITSPQGLQPFLDSSSERDRAFGVLRLRQIGSAEDIPLLLEAYVKEPIKIGAIEGIRGVKYYSLMAIGEIGGPAAESALIDMAVRLEPFGNIDSLILADALCKALTKIGTIDAKSKLEDIYADTFFDWGAREYALTGLLLIELKNRNFESIGDSVAYLCEKISSHFAIDMKKYEDFIISNAAKKALIEISSEKSLIALDDILSNINSNNELKRYLIEVRKSMEHKKNNNH